MNVRATEYTVGENGPENMPAPLPPQVGYTYCVEMSVDEALSAGATDAVQPAVVLLRGQFSRLPRGHGGAGGLL
ncbi:MAG: hypothetical protein HS132_10180 [Planctomycetia bacterium]|nr:hypothetical protein [Planctomycetia bacterium]